MVSVGARPWGRGRSGDCDLQVSDLGKLLAIFPAHSGKPPIPEYTPSAAPPWQVDRLLLFGSDALKTLLRLGDPTKIKPALSRDRCSNTPVALCFLWYRRLSATPPLLSLKMAYRNPKTALTRGGIAERLCL